MVVKECLVYSSTLKKKIPCLLNENELIEVKTGFDVHYCVHVTYDSSKFVEYNVLREEIMKYCSEFIPIKQIYPATVQAEKDYADECMPIHYAKATIIPSVCGSFHNSKELDRIETLINMLVVDIVGDISSEMFHCFISFIMYELYFTYCDATERTFLDSLSASQLTEQPGTVEVPQIVRILKLIFSKYSGTKPNRWKILNFKNFSEFVNDTPITIRLVNLEYNCNYITGI